MVQPPPEGSSLRTLLRIVGPVTLVGGIVLFFAFLSQFDAFGSRADPFSARPRMPSAVLMFLAFGLLAAGGAMTQLGYMRPMARYVAQETSDGVRIGAEAMGEGFVRGAGRAQADGFCTGCGGALRAGDRFCGACGRARGG